MERWSKYFESLLQSEPKIGPEERKKITEN